MEYYFYHAHLRLLMNKFETDPRNISLDIKNAYIEKQEIQDGYVYTFLGTDYILSLIFILVRYKRNLQPNLKFELTVQDPGRNLRLKISGPEGIKEQLTKEMEFFNIIL